MIKERNPLVVILLTLITCGFYGLFWLYATSDELNSKGSLEMSPVLIILLCFIPFVNLFAIWKYCAGIEKLSGGNTSGILLFILAIIFFPAFYFIAQSELNKHAGAAA